MGRQWRKYEGSKIVNSEKMARCSYHSRYLFFLLLGEQDDMGRYPATPTKLRSLIVTTEWTPDYVMNTLVPEMSQIGLLRLEKGFIVVTKGAVFNGTPSNAKTVFLYDDVEVAEPELSSDSVEAEPELSIKESEVEPELNKSRESRESKKELEERVVVIEPDFKLLTTLQGFKSISEKQKDIITVACRSKGVDVISVVKEFADYWEVGRLKHNWKNPSLALTRSIFVSIDKSLKLKGKNNGRPQISADQSSTTSKDRLDFRNRINAH